MKWELIKLREERKRKDKIILEMGSKLQVAQERIHSNEKALKKTRKVTRKMRIK